MSIYREMLESWLKNLDINCKNCLDVGGGAKPVKDRVRSWNVEKYHIWDECTEAQVPDVMKLCDDYKTLDIQFIPTTQLSEYKGLYDVVFMLEVAEYLWNPLEALINIWLTIKEGGIFYSSWPFVYPLHQPVENDYLRYTSIGVQKLLHSARFSNIEITPRVATKGKSNLLEFYKREGMHVAGNSQHIGYLVKAIKK